MNYKLTQLISEQQSNLKVADYTIAWTDLAKSGYHASIMVAKDNIHDALSNMHIRTTESNSAKGLRVQAHQYVFSSQELESITQQAFNIGVEHATNAVRLAVEPADYKYMGPESRSQAGYE